ncbi:MAG: type II/IV secretion system protein [Phycisphaerales bacterium]|nr:type II/IV secretion system protein [Phycisphaerales bacterium]
MLAALDAESKILLKMLEKGAMTRSTARSLQLESAQSGLPMIESLLLQDIISEEDVARAYADLNGMRFLDLTRRRPSAPWVLSLPENISRRLQCIVFGDVSGQLVVVVADPVDARVAGALREHFDKPLQFVVGPRYQIAQIQDEIYGDARTKGARIAEITPVHRTAATLSASGLNVVEQLDSIIDEAVDRRASDIHIEPEEDRLRVRMRIDGRMIEARALPLDAAPAVVSRVKVLTTLDITERRKPQDGRFTQRSFEQDIDIRVAIIPTIHGERITMRLLNMNRSVIDLGTLGMDIETKQAFERLIRRPHGIMLVTGPTGSGKSTTLYAALQQINRIDQHIITVEDPVEYHIAGVNQIQVDSEHGVTFARAMRSILRHDPDVIMVGEIRDQETAHLALEASLTGHLVLATLHTNSAVGALTRLVDMGCEPYLVSSAMIGILAQRLVRRICDNCKKPFDANDTERRLLDIPDIRGQVKIYRGTGCARCGRAGYFDRVGIYEFVPFDSGLAELVMNTASTEALYRHALDHGCVTLRMDAVKKVLHGLTTLEEALRVTVTET